MSAFGSGWGRTWGGPESDSIPIINTDYVPITLIESMIILKPGNSINRIIDPNYLPNILIQKNSDSVPVIKNKANLSEDNDIINLPTSSIDNTPITLPKTSIKKK